jgi:hypothetical protein
MTITSDTLYANIGSRITALRKRRKFSQADLAKLLPKNELRLGCRPLNQVSSTSAP